MSLDYELMGFQIKKIRKYKRISQAYLAEKTNLSVPYISQIERAIKHASLSTVVKIANALEVTVDRLLYGNQKNNRCEYDEELKELIADCNNYEKRIIYDTMSALKKVIRDNKNLPLSNSKQRFRK